jgi:hypothetical protein
MFPKTPIKGTWVEVIKENWFNLKMEIICK